jgi:hypothetical protein
MPSREMDYLALLKYYRHLAECFKFAVNLQKELLEKTTKGMMEVGEVIEYLNGIMEEVEKLFPLSREEINNLEEKVRGRIEYYDKKYGSLRYPLEPEDRKELLRITVPSIMRSLYRLLMIGVESVKDPSELKIVPARKFPNKIVVKMGEKKVLMDETFVIGRVSEGDKDYIAIRKFPYEMSFKELMSLVESEDKFKVRYKSDIELKRRFDEYLRASRIHLVIWHDGSCYRMADVSRTYTIVEIDENRYRIAGYRTYINQPLLTQPLGKQNKIWICGTPDETPVEIFT